jgi:predicted nucleic acid-binding protein
VRSIILDSGALVALFDASDNHHAAMRAKLAKEAASVRLLTTWPCVTEATHILERVDFQLALLAFLRGGRCEVREFGAGDLDHFMNWIGKYRDRPMDFADASLLWLALEIGSAEILTTDRADFETYRLPGGKRFKLL